MRACVFWPSMILSYYNLTILMSTSCMGGKWVYNVWTILTGVSKVDFLFSEIYYCWRAIGSWNSMYGNVVMRRGWSTVRTDLDLQKRRTSFSVCKLLCVWACVCVFYSTILFSILILWHNLWRLRAVDSTETLNNV